MRGRKPKPNALHKAQSSGKARKNEPEFATGNLNPPSCIKGRELEIWNETVADLYGIGMGSRIESHALARYCEAVAQSEKCARILEIEGIVAQTERGTVRHPATMIQNAASLRVLRFAAEFGFTPASRGRVTHIKTEDDNPFADL